MIFILFVVSRLLLVLNACETNGCFLPASYDKKIRPNTEKRIPTDIKFQLYIESFSSLDVSKMEFNAYGYLMQRWNDNRLKGLNNTPVILEGKDSSHIWLPDLYCVDCRSSNLESGYNAKECMVRITQDGNVYFSTGVSLVGSCHMDLRLFPFDKQQCSLQFTSYSYNLSFINFTWFKTPYVKETSMDQYVVTNVEAKSRIDDYNGHKFMIINAVFTFDRRVGFYILQLYLPTAMLVCLSWGMLCLDQESSGDRITIGLTLFLTMIFLHGYANTSLPRVSYIKSVDLFMVVSLCEILLILVESLVVTNMYVKQKKKDERTKRRKMLSQKIFHQENKMEGREKIEELNLDNGLIDRNKNNGSVLRRAKKFTDDKPESYELKLPISGLRVDNVTNNLQEGRQLLGHNLTQEECNSSCNCPLYLTIEKCCTVLLPLSYVVFNLWYWVYYMYIIE